jgi:hypothetical protein
MERSGMEGLELSLFLMRFYPRTRICGRSGMAEYDYTEANLIAVRAAKIAYVTGTRKVRLSMGDKSIEYAVSSKKDLDEMETEIIAALPAKPHRFFLTSTSKGL